MKIPKLANQSIAKILKESLFFALIILLMSACSGENVSNKSKTIGNQQESVDAHMDYSRNTSTSAQSPQSDLKNESKIIKRGNLNFNVSDLNKSKTRVDSLVLKYKAYYEQEQFNSFYNNISYSLLIRIPNANFDALMAELENDIGKLNAKNVNQTDVTEEYVDLNIRLENNLAYLNQYKEVLKKAKTIEEILKVKEKIRKIEEEIESKKGRIQFLDSQVSYSTIKLEISELISTKISNQPTFGRRVNNAFKNGIDGFLNFIVVLVNLWPFLILAILLMFFRKPLFNLFRKKNSKVKN